MEQSLEKKNRKIKIEQEKSYDIIQLDLSLLF